jgi:hypothetical protein
VERAARVHLVLVLEAVEGVQLLPRLVAGLLLMEVAADRMDTSVEVDIAVPNTATAAIQPTIALRAVKALLDRVIRSA